ncbi:MAG: hypothetical protein DMD35_18080 [Gemmatimonadetes bacterium]|nr:MAG: hypothetical protein DMD35_18080 [Gemmatimonadota bacterium]
MLVRQPMLVFGPISLVVGAMACGASSDVPSMPDVRWPETASVADALGDTCGLAGTVEWDVSALTIARETDGIVVLLDFANEVVLPVPGD